MIVDAIKSLSYNRLTKIGFVLFGTILAPFMFIFQFASHVFKLNSFAPLVLISACVGLPVCLTIFVLRVWDDAGLDSTDPKERLATRFEQMSTSSLFSGIGFYFVCCLKFLEPSLGLRDAVGYMIPFYGAIIIDSIISISRGGTKALHERLLKHLENSSKNTEANS